jgi:hypothetical protein
MRHSNARNYEFFNFGMRFQSFLFVLARQTWPSWHSATYPLFLGLFSWFLCPVPWTNFLIFIAFSWAITHRFRFFWWLRNYRAPDILRKPIKETRMYLGWNNNFLASFYSRTTSSSSFYAFHDLNNNKFLHQFWDKMARICLVLYIKSFYLVTQPDVVFIAPRSKANFSIFNIFCEL